jgi:hypothetical protein
MLIGVRKEREKREKGKDERVGQKEKKKQNYIYNGSADVAAGQGGRMGNRECGSERQTHNTFQLCKKSSRCRYDRYHYELIETHFSS